MRRNRASAIHKMALDSSPSAGPPRLPAHPRVRSRPGAMGVAQNIFLLVGPPARWRHDSPDGDRGLFDGFMTRFSVPPVPLPAVSVWSPLYNTIFRPFNWWQRHGESGTGWIPNGLIGIVTASWWCCISITKNTSGRSVKRRRGRVAATEDFSIARFIQTPPRVEISRMQHHSASQLRPIGTSLASTAQAKGKKKFEKMMLNGLDTLAGATSGYAYSFKNIL